MDNWIFCSDELPDPNKDDVYLVLWRVPDLNIVFYEIQEFWKGEWIINIPCAKGKSVEIIAWQELPKMPKELERYEW